MTGFLAKIAAIFTVEVLQRVLQPLLQMIIRAIERNRAKNADQKETSDVLEAVKSAQTEAEKIEAARRSARNGS